MWKNSLYRRIALAFVLLVAGIIAAQGAVFLWVLNRAEQSEPLIVANVRAAAQQLGADLAATPQLDVTEYLTNRAVGQPLFAILMDGRIFGRRPPDNIVRIVLDQFKRRNNVSASWENSTYHGFPIVVAGKTIGVIGVVPQSTLERYGGQMALIGVMLLVSGTTLAALLIGGPLKRRLTNLGATARRIGSGDLAARAMVSRDDDELAAFARTFNAMAVQLEARAQQLQASDHARSQLVAEVSHELMTPMTAIRGHLETLAMDDVYVDPPTRQRFVAVMTRETRRLERLIGDLLDMARLEAGGGGLDLQAVHVEDLFDGILDHHERECRTRDIRLTYAVGPGAEVVTGDPFRIDQAVDNITANALRHTADGGAIVLRASLTAPDPAGPPRVQLTVTDSGEGIPPDELPLIFDRFYKARSGKRDSAGGSGLGLSIVKAIVERHGGRVWATSQVGQGTTIVLEFPAGSTMVAREPLAPERLLA